MSIQRLEKLIDRLKGLSLFIEDSADKIIDRDRKFLVDENRNQLKVEGQTTENLPVEYLPPRKTPTGRYGWYSAGYERTKPGNVLYVDLFLSGDFHRSLVLLKEGKGNWKFNSVDRKYKYLLANYGEKILGVSEDFLDHYTGGVMQPDLQSRTDKYLEV